MVRVSEAWTSYYKALDRLLTGTGSGGYPKFVSQGLNSQYLPVWLQEAGYQTYYTGKLFNAHTIENYNAPFAAGWTGSDFLLDPYTYSYLNSSWQRNRDSPVSHEGDYTTDVLARKAKEFLHDAINVDQPFFLAIAPVAPHSNVDVHDGDIVDPGADFTITPPIAAARHQDLFNDRKIPRSDHFNPEKVRQGLFRFPDHIDTIPGQWCELDQSFAQTDECSGRLQR